MWRWRQGTGKVAEAAVEVVEEAAVEEGRNRAEAAAEVAADAEEVAGAAVQGSGGGAHAVRPRSAARQGCGHLACLAERSFAARRCRRFARRPRSPPPPPPPPPPRSVRAGSLSCPSSSRDGRYTPSLHAVRLCYVASETAVPTLVRAGRGWATAAGPVQRVTG